jgi:hypothetical protein
VRDFGIEKAFGHLIEMQQNTVREREREMVKPKLDNRRVCEREKETRKLNFSASSITSKRVMKIPQLYFFVFFLLF